MAIDDISYDRKTSFVAPEGHSHTPWFIAIAGVLALVVIGELADHH